MKQNIEYLNLLFTNIYHNNVREDLAYFNNASLSVLSCLNAILDIPQLNGSRTKGSAIFFSIFSVTPIHICCRSELSLICIS